MEKTLINILKELNYEYTVKNGELTVTHNGRVNLANVTAIMDSAKYEHVYIENNGDFIARSLKVIPDDYCMTNNGIASFDSVTKIGSGVMFQNNGILELNKLEDAPSDTFFQNNDSLYLQKEKNPDCELTNNGKVFSPVAIKTNIAVAIKTNITVTNFIPELKKHSTGLLDSKGSKIYYGDVVISKNEKYIVCYRYGSTHLKQPMTIFTITPSCFSAYTIIDEVWATNDNLICGYDDDEFIIKLSSNPF
jgi:hypothetical protein